MSARLMATPIPGCGSEGVRLPEMVERVALALWRARELRMPKHTRRMRPDDIDYASGAWANTVSEAVAAITAMRAPTQAMVCEAERRHGFVEAFTAEDAWSTMIDGALAPIDRAQAKREAGR